MIPRIWVMRVVCILAVCVLIPKSMTPAKSFTYYDDTWKYYLHDPKVRDANAPLVLVLHGYDDRASKIRNLSNFDALSDLHGFGVVYPQALRDETGRTHWNVSTQNSERDDAGLIAALIADVQRKHDYDLDRTFVVGFSNGGFMAYRLVCQKHGVFAAFAVVAGTMSGADWKSCTPTPAVPLLHIHGLDDDIVPVDGSLSTELGWGGAPSIDQVITRWAYGNGAQTNKTDVVYSDGLRRRYYDQDHALVTEFTLLKDYGHEWPAGYDDRLFAAEGIWTFFQAVAP